MGKKKITGCCETMTAQLNYKCKQHNDTNCPDVVIIKSKAHRYLLCSPNAHYVCYFCPWCGNKLQEPEEDTYV